MSDGEAKQTPKAVNYERIPDKVGDDTHPIRAMLVDLIATNEARFGHLKQARIGLCWQTDCKPGPDGSMIYGKLVVLSDFQKEWIVVRGGENPLCYDAIIVINKDWWMQEATAEGGKRTSDSMHRGLLVHLLLQFRARIGVDGNQKEDERGRNLYRKAKPDLIAFSEEIKDGAWNEEQQHAYRKVLEFSKTLFDNVVDDQVESGIAGQVGTSAGKEETTTKAATG